MAEIGNWKPIRDTHAIQMAAIGVTFSDSLSLRPWERVRGLVAPKAKQLGLDKEEAQAAIQFTMGPGGPMPVPQQPNVPASIDYLRMERADFFSDRFTVNRQGLRYEEWSYTRWAALLEKASAVMEEAFAEYTDTVMATIYVDYIDVFAADKNIDAPDCGEVVSRSSDLIAPAAYDPSKPWHTYSGHFEAVSPEIRRLHQVNIDVSDFNIGVETTRAIQIRTLITDQFNLPFLSSLPADKQTWTVVREQLDSLHRAANGTVKRVLTGSASNAISLRVE